MILGQRRGRRGQDDLAVTQHDDVLTDLEDFLEMVRDIEDRHTARHEGAHTFEEPAYSVALECRGRLVEQEDPRTSHKRAGDLDDLALLDGECAALHTGIDVEVPLAQYLSRLGAHGTPVDDAAVPWPVTEEDVLGDRQLGDHHRVLEDGRDATSPGTDIAERRSGLAVEANLPGVGGDQARQNRDERRFTRTVAAHEAEAVAGQERGVDAQQRLRAAEALADAGRLDDRLACAHRMCAFQVHRLSN